MIGFAIGGVGLGVYFRHWVDFVIPIILAIGVTYTIGFSSAQAFDDGWMLGAGLAAFYGYARVQDSNARLSDTTS